MKALKDTGTRNSLLHQWYYDQKNQKRLLVVSFTILPLLLITVFTIIPLIQMFAFSFFDMRYIGKREFVGLGNYIEIFHRKDIWASLKLSLYYMVGSFLQIGAALYLAAILSFKIKGSNFFKGSMFFPYLVNGIAVGFIFKFFFTHGYVVDTLLQALGFELDSLPYWLKDRSTNNWALVASACWRYFGWDMVLFIGAIMSIDNSIYEAADLDGANGFQKFVHIVLPNIKPVVLLTLILSIKGALSAFDEPYVMTDGRNGTATYFIMMHRIAHEQQQVGLASAMAFILLAMILIVTVFQKIIFKHAIKE